MTANTKGLGIKQLSLIYRMLKEGLIVRTICDHRDNSRDNQLQDIEGDNAYESVPERIVQTLFNRGIFKCTSINRCLEIDIDEFRLSDDVIQKLNLSQHLNNTQP